MPRSRLCPCPRPSLTVLLSSALAFALVCGCGSTERRADPGSDLGNGAGPYIVPPPPVPPAPPDAAATGTAPFGSERGFPDDSGLPGPTSPTSRYDSNPFETHPSDLNHNPFENPGPGGWGQPDHDRNPFTPPPVEAPRPPFADERPVEDTLRDLAATFERDEAGRIVLVDLSGSRVINDDLAVLRGLRTLRQLDVSSTGITDEGLAHLVDLPELQLLALSGTGVSDAGIARLKTLRLRFLLLGFTAVSDRSVETLSAMTQLEGLSLRGTRITPDGVARLKRALPNCRIVSDPPETPAPRTSPEPRRSGNEPANPFESAPKKPKRTDGPKLNDTTTPQGFIAGLPAGTALRPATTAPSEAEQHLIRLLVGGLADPGSWNAVGQFCVATGRLNAAIPWLRAAVHAVPESRLYRYHYGVALAHLGRMDQAFEQFEAAVGTSAAHYNLGVISYQSGNVLKSHGHFSDALRYNPDLEPAREWLERVNLDIATSRGSDSSRAAMQR